MAKDKYTAVWVSHSSMSDYLRCPRSYYLKNMYRDPKNNRKMTVMQPALALGQAVHEVIESLSRLPMEERWQENLFDKYERTWTKLSGKLGGFKDITQEEEYKEKGRGMIARIVENPGPLANKAIKIRQELPYYWLSEEDNIILCGKIDWLEYLEQSNSVHIIDFKTGKFDEDPDSLQLPIYYLLVTHCQARAVSRVSYWYLERDKTPIALSLPNEEEAYKRIIEIAKKIQLARKLEHFKCPRSEGCMFCRPFEQVLAGKAEHVGVNEYGADVFILR